MPAILKQTFYPLHKLPYILRDLTTQKYSFLQAFRSKLIVKPAYVNKASCLVFRFVFHFHKITFLVKKIK